MRFIRKNPQAFTLVEVMIAASIFIVAMVGVLYSYLKCMELAELGRTTSLAVQAVKNKVEDIKATSFSTIFATYNNSTFSTAGLNGKGVVYVDNSNPNLLKVKVVFCWKQSNGRIIGEDKNLNGVLDAGEDKNGNGQLDSIVQVMTYVYG